jgi:hypothetical protein
MAPRWYRHALAEPGAAEPLALQEFVEYGDLVQALRRCQQHADFFQHAFLAAGGFTAGDRLWVQNFTDCHYLTGRA